jgi:hypothetical protein
MMLTTKCHIRDLKADPGVRYYTIVVDSLGKLILKA